MLTRFLTDMQYKKTKLAIALIAGLFLSLPMLSNATQKTSHHNLIDILHDLSVIEKDILTLSFLDETSYQGISIKLKEKITQNIEVKINQLESQIAQFSNLKESMQIRTLTTDLKNSWNTINQNQGFLNQSRYLELDRCVSQLMDQIEEEMTLKNSQTFAFINAKYRSIDRSLLKLVSQYTYFYPLAGQAAEDYLKKELSLFRTELPLAKFENFAISDGYGRILENFEQQVYSGVFSSPNDIISSTIILLAKTAQYRSELYEYFKNLDLNNKMEIPAQSNLLSLLTLALSIFLTALISFFSSWKFYTQKIKSITEDRLVLEHNAKSEKSKINSFFKDLIAQHKKEDSIFNDVLLNIDEIKQGSQLISDRSLRIGETLGLNENTATIEIPSFKRFNQAVTDIENVSTKIGDIDSVVSDISNKTKIIDDIVFKTQLLAINAAIEAARAGENGRGFAVVASEVSNLAKISGDAAFEINTLVKASKGKIQEIKEKTQIGLEKCKSSSIEVSDDMHRWYQSLNPVKQNLIELNQTNDAQIDLLKATKLHLGEFDNLKASRKRFLDGFFSNLQSRNDHSHTHMQNIPLKKVAHTKRSNRVTLQNKPPIHHTITSSYVKLPHKNSGLSKNATKPIAATYSKLRPTKKIGGDISKHSSQVPYDPKILLDRSQSNNEISKMPIDKLLERISKKTERYLDFFPSSSTSEYLTERENTKGTAEAIDVNPFDQQYRDLLEFISDQPDLLSKEADDQALTYHFNEINEKLNLFIDSLRANQLDDPNVFNQLQSVKLKFTNELDQLRRYSPGTQRKRALEELANNFQGTIKSLINNNNLETIKSA